MGRVIGGMHQRCSSLLVLVVQTLTPAQHATLSSFPTLRQVLTRLLFSSEPSSEHSVASPTSRVSSPVPSQHQPSSPKHCYPMLPSEDKIAILAFMCNVAVSSKSVHAHMEVCEEELTSRRKEKIELNRTRKALYVDKHFLLLIRLITVSQHRGARGPSRREQGE